MQATAIKLSECPYGAEDCPKVSKLEADLKSIKRCLYAVVIFLAGEFGTRFIEVLL